MAMSAPALKLSGPPELKNFVPRDEVASNEQPQTEQELLPEQQQTEQEHPKEEHADTPEYQSESQSDSDENPRGLTENLSATYVTSGSACLDFFFQIVPDTPANRVKDLVVKAWEEDALATLKLIFQLRGIRGTGKSDKLHFYDAACWMYDNHPQTLTANINKVAPVGYFKDLLELIQRILEGEKETAKRMSLKEEHRRKRNRTKAFGYGRRLRSTHGYFARKGAAARAAKEEGTLKPREERIAESLEKNKVEKEKAAVLRKEKILSLASRVVEKHSNDPTFAALYNAVAKHFADALAKDLEAWRVHKAKARLSLAAKWCPSLDSSYDKQTLLCEAIACSLFPKTSSPEYSEMPHHQYVYKVRDKLRKEVLVPLREALQLPEVYMSAQKWDVLPYNRVASVAMKTYKELFLKHDEERFKAYLDNVEVGKAKIAAGALLPHDILLGALEADESARVAELQWKAMVEEMKQKGKLENSISICDVSGSMEGMPMTVCIALGILTAELSEEPWKGKLITFSNEPAFHELKGETLKEKHEFTQSMPWGMNTDFQKVFDRILELAKACNLPPDRMVKRLFVYSDMEFDQARVYSDAWPPRRESINDWPTDYKVITEKFREAGYGNPPQIVFWNLRDSMSVPVMKDQPGVALVSGFSKNLLKMFLDNSGEIDPMLIMKQAISDPIFEDMVVVD